MEIKTSMRFALGALVVLAAACGTTPKDATFPIPNGDQEVLIGAAVLGMIQQGNDYSFDPATGRVESKVLSAGSRNEVQYNIVAMPTATGMEITTTYVDADGKIDGHVPDYTARFKSLVDDIVHFMDAEVLAYVARMNREGTWSKLEGMVRVGQNVEAGCESVATIAVPVVKMISAPMYFKQINFMAIADKVARVQTLLKGGNYFQSIAGNVAMTPGGFSAQTEVKLHGTGFRCPQAAAAVAAP